MLEFCTVLPGQPLQGGIGGTQTEQSGGEGFADFLGRAAESALTAATGEQQLPLTNAAEGTMPPLQSENPQNNIDMDVIVVDSGVDRGQEDLVNLIAAVLGQEENDGFLYALADRAQQILGDKAIKNLPDIEELEALIVKLSEPDTEGEALPEALAPLLTLIPQPGNTQPRTEDHQIKSSGAIEELGGTKTVAIHSSQSPETAPLTTKALPEAEKTSQNTTATAKAPTQIQSNAPPDTAQANSTPDTAQTYGSVNAAQTNSRVNTAQADSPPEPIQADNPADTQPVRPEGESKRVISSRTDGTETTLSPRDPLQTTAQAAQTEPAYRTRSADGTQKAAAVQEPQTQTANAQTKAAPPAETTETQTRISNAAIRGKAAYRTQAVRTVQTERTTVTQPGNANIKESITTEDAKPAGFTESKNYAAAPAGIPETKVTEEAPSPAVFAVKQEVPETLSPPVEPSPLETHQDSPVPVNPEPNIKADSTTATMPPDKPETQTVNSPQTVTLSESGGTPPPAQTAQEVKTVTAAEIKHTNDMTDNTQNLNAPAKTEGESHPDSGNTADSGNEPDSGQENNNQTKRPILRSIRDLSRATPPEFKLINTGGTAPKADTAEETKETVSPADSKSQSTLPAMEARVMNAESVPAESPAAPLRQALSQNLIDQIVNNAALKEASGGMTLEIELNPKLLGKISVELVSQNGELRAKIRAENDTTKALLGSSLDALKDQMKDAGIHMRDIEVGSSKASLDQGNAGQEFARQWQGGRYGNGNSPRSMYASRTRQSDSESDTKTLDVQGTLYRRGRVAASYGGRQSGFDYRA